MQVRYPSLAIRSVVQPIGPIVNALEAGTIFLLLLSYIWYFQARVHWSWMILLAIVLASHALRRESPVDLGLRKEGFAECARRFAIPVLLVAAAGVVVGFAFDTVRHVAAWRVAVVLTSYCFWALFQQYLLNGYFANRLQASFDTKYQFLVAPMAGAMFAAAHVPNPLLMGVTLVGGTVAAFAYQRHKNLFFLALAHALIGTMLWLVVPDTVSHHLRVGPGMRRTHVHAAHHSPPSDATPGSKTEAPGSKLESHQ